MRILKNINELNVSLPIIATSDYFISLGSTDWGYFEQDGWVLPFYIKSKYFFKYMLFTTGVLGKGTLSQKDFLDQLIIYIRSEFKIDFIALQHVTALFETSPTLSSACRFGSYI